MAFRTVRTAAVASLVLTVAAGCAGTSDGTSGGTDTVAVLPDTTVQLSAEQLARLPLYGVRELPCDTVLEYLGIDADSAETPPQSHTVEISLEGGELVIDPEVLHAGRGDTIVWVSDGARWTAEFKEMSPLRDGRPRVPGRAGGDPSGEPAVVPRAVSVVSNSAACGRYFYVLAAYHPDRPGDIYISDPPIWIRY